ncbi:hypothetical protein OAS39_04570 [Pirellulales bacterium]|nr:hypothetical protein [Pirellulales bacterium]
MAYSELHEFDPNDDESFDKIRGLFGPSHADQVVRHALQAVWMTLPKENRNVDELERQFRRLADRALNNMRDDDQAFGAS